VAKIALGGEHIMYQERSWMMVFLLLSGDKGSPETSQYRKRGEDWVAEKEQNDRITTNDLLRKPEKSQKTTVEQPKFRQVRCL